MFSPLPHHELHSFSFPLRRSSKISPSIKHPQAVAAQVDRTITVAYNASPLDLLPASVLHQRRPFNWLPAPRERQMATLLHLRLLTEGGLCSSLQPGHQEVK
jgi:hypothetical protein